MTGIALGATTCFEVRAVDLAGNVSAFSKPVCTARPVDDRRLVADDGWKRLAAKTFFNGTATSTSTQGATLTRAGVHLDRVGVLVTTCPTCGRITVLVGTKEIGALNLRSAKTHQQVVRLLPRFKLRTGTVQIVVASKGKPVTIDGLVSLQF